MIIRNNADSLRFFAYPVGRPMTEDSRRAGQAEVTSIMYFQIP